jgi:ATP-dependent Zn protease
MAVALGGRVAEELIFGEDDITTGASGDFQQVTRTARLMVTQLGFSKKLGQVRALTCLTSCFFRLGYVSGWCICRSSDCSRVC